jgi:NRAMP (natural resistance-associated macrophage protein)-like metal ion transporter
MKFFDMRRFLFFFAMIGPGVISAIAGNDAGGIATYSVAGARFGYGLLWTLIPLTFFLVIIQEMCSRMGVVTGKGLADLIRENFGLRMTLLLMCGLFVANFATTISEFAGMAAAAQLLGLNKWVVVIGAAFFVLFLIIKVEYHILERVFLFMCLFYLTYVISGVLANPDWTFVAEQVMHPGFSFDKSYLVLLVGLIGTTITPWMQFYLQSSIVEKGVKVKEYIYAKWEIVLGCVVTNAIAFFIILAAGATLFPEGVVVETAAEAAGALTPVAGQLAGVLFAVGLFAAALFGAFILPLSTAYYVCEAFGFESGVNKKFADAKVFYGVIGVLILPAVVVVLLPNVPLIGLMILAQVINGLMLPFILLTILYLVNQEKLMGEYVNSSWYNTVCYSAAFILIVVTMIMVGTTLLAIV